MTEKTFIFTGGGSGGHVMPAISLIQELQNDSSSKFLYIGSKTGVEKKLIRQIDIPYEEISTGKLRRYLSFENIKDVFKVLWGIIQSYFILLQYSRKNCLIVATGGFVIIPVVIAGWLQGKSIVVHEQTSRVGLANKIAGYFAKKILVTFESSVSYFPQEKVSVVGYPLRKEIFTEATGRYAHISKPILFVTGGGNGSLLLNQAIEEIRVDLLKDYYVVHQVGEKHFEAFKGYATDDYEVHAFVKEEMVDLLKEASVVVSRSGAGTVMELIALAKPSVFIPLKIAQKNEQFHNAMEAHRKIGSIVIEEKNLTSDTLKAAVQEISSVKKVSPSSVNPTGIIASLLKEDLA